MHSHKILHFETWQKPTYTSNDSYSGLVSTYHKTNRKQQSKVTTIPCGFSFGLSKTTQKNERSLKQSLIFLNTPTSPSTDMNMLQTTEDHLLDVGAPRILFTKTKIKTLKLHSTKILCCPT